MRTTIAALLLFGLVTPASAQPPRPIVIELFTSQGCSSCPPADALLGELAQNPNILPLAFHVTYWNSLGWRDPFSLDIATQRQRLYQGLLRTDTIYTPQMIVEGRTDVVGSDRAGVTRAIARAQAPADVPLVLTEAAGALNIDIGSGAGEAAVFLVGYDSAHHTSVARGENAGRQLRESNIVRSFAMLSTWHGLPTHLASPRPAGEHAAVILQAADGHIIGAAMLPKHSTPAG